MQHNNLSQLNHNEHTERSEESLAVIASEARQSIPEGWKVLELGDVCKTISDTYDLRNKEEIVFLNTSDVYDGKVLIRKPVPTRTLPGQAKKKIQKGDILYSEIRPANRRFAFVDFEAQEYVVSTKLMVLRPNQNINPKYLLLFLSSFEILNHFQVLAESRSGTFPQITFDTIKYTSIPVPSLTEQQKIAEVLGALDEKIELNRKMNKTLESLGQAIFKKWFVDFENKSAWQEIKLGDLFPVKTGKKDANFSSEKGKYPFFTCSQGHLMANDYSFDGSALLLAGNGDFNIKWYEGKFEAYQRTYVLEPYEKNLLGFLYFLVEYSLDDITAGHRGSVINFLTKGMIEDFVINLPPIEEIKTKSPVFNDVIKNIDFNKRQIETLSQVRDSLLPRLMSGRLRVK